MTATPAHAARLARIRNSAGSVTHVQGACTCGWRSTGIHPVYNTTEGWKLGERDALAHASSN
jgi:hypothetical protein